MEFGVEFMNLRNSKLEKSIELRKLIIGFFILLGSVFMTVEYQNCSPAQVDLGTLNQQIIQQKHPGMSTDTSPDINQDIAPKGVLTD